MGRENNITDISEYRTKKEETKKGSGYRIDIQAAAARFQVRLPELIKRRNEEAMEVGDQRVPTLEELETIDDGYASSGREERDTQAALGSCKTGMVGRILKL